MRPIVTLVVAIAVLWGSMFAPSHATAMAFEAAAIASHDHAKPPCPMSMGKHAHEGQTDDESLSGSGDINGMTGDMHCCPALALSPALGFGDVFQVETNLPLEMTGVETNRFGTPVIEPRPPRS